MKRWIVMLLALITALTLTACSENTGETENDKTPEEPPAQGEDSAGQGEELAQEEEKDHPLYIFVNGQLVGSWEDGAWISAVPVGESENGTFVSAGDSETRDYTVAELLAEEGYYLYTPERQGELCTQCEFYTESDGYGLEEDQPGAAALLDPYAVAVPEWEWDKRTFAFPTILEGEAADVTMPDYSFGFTFNGLWPELAVSRPLTELPCYAQEDGNEAFQSVASYALQELGIEGDFRLTAALVGTDEAYLAVNSAYDEGGYLPEEAEQIFSFVLRVLPEGEVETVYQHVEPYTGDVLSTFRIFIQGVADLNGDGTLEVCLRDVRWEWGYYYVMARGEDGTWQRVLQADYGM